LKLYYSFFKTLFIFFVLNCIILEGTFYYFKLYLLFIIHLAHHLFIQAFKCAFFSFIIFLLIYLKSFV